MLTEFEAQTRTIDNWFSFSTLAYHGNIRKCDLDISEQIITILQNLGIYLFIMAMTNTLIMSPFG